MTGDIAANERARLPTASKWITTKWIAAAIR
jgi:hypothetical protein